MGRTLTSGWLRTVSIVCVILSYAISGNATTAVVPRDRDMVVGARAIITGEVIKTETGMDPSRVRIYTYVTVRIDQVIKGSITSREVVLKEPGGQFQGLATGVDGAPKLAKGNRVLLYLDTWFDGALRVHQMFLGQFSIVKDPATGKDFVERSTPGASVEIMPDQEGEGAATSKMEMTSYVKMVRRILSENLKESKEFEAKHYAGINVRTEPAEYRQLSGAGGLEPQFHIWTDPSVRWFQADTGQPVGMYVNSDMSPVATSNLATDINNAMNAWNNVPGTSLQLQIAGNTTDCIVAGGVSLIYFNDCDGLFSAGSGCAGILGIGGYNLAGPNSEVVNGTTFLNLDQSFVTINPGAGCYYDGNDCNLEETLTHELGHSWGALHSWDPTYADATTPATAVQLAATMFYVAHFDGRCAQIESDDVNCILFVYPGKVGTPSGLVISTGSLPGATSGTAYSQALAATGGSPPYSWSLARGSGPLPPGL
ncbi:MAG TPA: hypothetical protein VI756_00715, partial [Blastocatellia bacterium]